MKLCKYQYDDSIVAVSLLLLQLLLTIIIVLRLPLLFADCSFCISPLIEFTLHRPDEMMLAEP